MYRLIQGPKNSECSFNKHAHAAAIVKTKSACEVCHLGQTGPMSDTPYESMNSFKNTVLF